MEFSIVRDKKGPIIVYAATIRLGFIGLASKPGNGGPYPLIDLEYPPECLGMVLAIANLATELKLAPQVFWTKMSGNIYIAVLFQYQAQFEKIRQFLRLPESFPWTLEPTDQIEFITTGEFEVEPESGFQAFLESFKQRGHFTVSISQGTGDARKTLWEQRVTEFKEGLPQNVLEH